jgi:excisionase family DNA binding protein
MARRLNYRLAKIHRTYTVEEAAGLFGVHRNTVRQWVKGGLPTIDERRPTLIHGRDLEAFLRARRRENRRRCSAGEIYCVRCRVPHAPAGGLAEYRPVTATSGNLIGICPSCDCVMYRRVSLAKLDEVRGGLDVPVAQALSHMSMFAVGRVGSGDLGVASLDGLISFFASHHAIRAEAVLKRQGHVATLVPGPRELSPNCGVALRFEYARRDEVLSLLAHHRVRIDGVHVYRPRTDEWGAAPR